MKIKNISGISMLAITLVMHSPRAWAESNQDIEAQIQQLTNQIQGLRENFDKSQIKVNNIEKNQSSIRTEISGSSSQPFIPPMFEGEYKSVTFGNQRISLTPYGIISLGVRNISNWGGKSVNQLEAGQYYGERLGGRLFLKINQNSSIAAIFELGYDGTNGSLGQGGKIFGRQVYVGYVDNRYGMISAGRQLDDMSQAMEWSMGLVDFDGASHVGDSDNLAQTVRLNNDLKYTSPVIYHTQISTSYAFSNTSSQSDNGAYSAGITYNNQLKNTGLRLGGGFLVLEKPNSGSNTTGAIQNDGYGYCSPFIKSQNGSSVRKQTIFAVGSEYRYYRTTIGGNYSNVSFKYMDETSLRLQNFEVFSMYKILPQLVGGASYVHTWGQYTNKQSPHYNQFSIALNYFINPHVTLFVADNYQKAGGSAKNAWIDLVAKSSTTQTQNQLVTGIRVIF